MAFLFKKSSKPRGGKKRKSKSAREILDRLNKYLGDGIEEPVQFLSGFWNDQANAITYQEIREAIINGYISEETMKVWRQDYSVLVGQKMNPLWQQSIAAGSVSQPVMDKFTASFKFDLSSPAVKSWIKDRGAQFVTAVVNEQKAAMRSLLLIPDDRKYTVDELSRVIRPCVGLTDGQAKANLKYYDNIKDTYQKEHPRTKPEIVQRKAREAAAKYAEKQHRYRAYNIAQTEMAFAYNRGADEGVRQAQSESLLGKMEKRWSTSRDGSVCDVCKALESMQIPMDNEFNFKGRLLFAGQRLTPPAHSHCACAIQYIEVEAPLFRGDSSADALNAGNADDKEQIPDHDAPQYLGSLDNLSDDVLKSTLEKYESEIAASEIENAVVVSKSGLVWRCFGDKNNVYPDVDLGDGLYGASVTHNHPAGSINEYSFSDADLTLFADYQLERLRGVDEKFIYELTRLATDVDEHASLDALMDLGDLYGRHEMVIDFAVRNGLGYRRWNR